MTQPTADVLIIGGGPAGATAALYTARADLKTIVIDKERKSGALGITTKIANYPGVPEVISGEELLERMWKQAQGFGAEFVKARITGVTIGDDTKQVFGADGKVYEGRAMILATGAMGRSSTVPGEEEFLGRGVSYCATCDAAFFRDQPVLVSGYNEEAAEESLFLTRFASSVVLASSKPKLNADPETLHLIDKTENITLRAGARLKQIAGDGSVTGAILTESGKEETVAVKGVFIFGTGNKPITDFLQGAVNVHGSGCLGIDKSDMSTNMPGVFGAGDVLCNDVKQAVVAAAEGCIAALSVDKYLHGRKAVKRDYN